MLLHASWGSTTVSSDSVAGPSLVHDTAVVHSNARQDRQLSHGFLSSQSCSSNANGDGTLTCYECCIYDGMYSLCVHGECAFSGCTTRSCPSCTPPCTDEPPPSPPLPPPSPSPPPPPPSSPPLTELPPEAILGGDTSDPSPPPPPPYECTLRACQVELLSEEQQATVKAVSQASTALISTVAATAVATTGVFAVVPLTFALQKSVILTNVGGSPALPVLAGVGEQMQWVQGRFGLFGFSSTAAGTAAGENATASSMSNQSDSGARRRLDGAPSGGSERRLVEDELRNTLLTSLTDFLLFFPLFGAVHMLLLRLWPRVCRRRSRRPRGAHSTRNGASGGEDAKGQSIRPLPSAFVFPNLEIVLVNFFAGGLTEAAASVLSAAAAGVVLGGGLVALAVLCLLAVIGFYAHEGVRLHRYFKRHDTALWEASEKVSTIEAVDDPLMRAMTRIGRAPSKRLRGVLEPAKADLAEPRRTLRAIGGSFKEGIGIRKDDTAGDRHARLSCWLAGASGRFGVFYQYVRTLLLLLTAVVSGSAAYGGEGGAAFAASLLVLIQLALAAYCALARVAADRLEGEVYGIEAVANAINVALLASAAGGEAEELGSVRNDTNGSASAADFVGAAATNVSDALDAADPDATGSPAQVAALFFAMVAVLVPFLLSIYDGLGLPLIAAVSDKDRRAAACVCLRNVLVVPLLAMVTFFSVNGAEATAEVAEDIVDGTLEAAEAKDESSDMFAWWLARLPGFQWDA